MTGDGLRMFTTLAVSMEKQAEQAIEHNLLSLESTPSCIPFRTRMRMQRGI
jgi:hypothetical protein